MRDCAFQKSSDGGYALIVVLIAILICAAMVVLLLERGALGLKSASSYRNAAQVRSLADMVQNIVQAQIQDATTIDQATDTPLGERGIWASQPGAIRVFNPSGTLRSIYKLYSSDTLVTTDTDLAGDVAADWYKRKSEYTDLNDPVVVSSGTRYPIINPGVSSLMSDAIGITSGFSINGAPRDATSPNANLAPMPVRWIYILQDGTMCQLGDSRIHHSDNPIVGRVAFWTDDETCKVNVNTAAPTTPESFWDAPRAFSNSERNLMSWAQPSQNEYQRYPGHPAMVSLRPILGGLDSLGNSEYYDLSPRYRWGGSEDGLKRINVARESLLINKQDRAYLNVDELLFESRSSAPRAFLDANRIESLRFFLTASSRAPELNLFGQPRVSIWPVHKEDSDRRRTPFDRLIAFCSTVGGKAYYFTRGSPWSPTDDFVNIPRNQRLYSYLQELTDSNILGSASFASKYGTDRDQILTEIFDYIRITNLNETYQGRAADFLSYTTDWKIDRLGGSATSVITPGDYPFGNPTEGAGLVVPIEINDTRGMGRFPVIAEVGLMFVSHAKLKANPPTVPTAPSPGNPEQLEGMLVIDTITPAFGYMPWCGKGLTVEVESSNVAFRVGALEQNLFTTGESDPIHYPPAVGGGQTPGGYDGAGYVPGSDSLRFSGNTSGAIPYKFFSPAIDLTSSDTTFSLLGGTVRINLKVDGVIVQKYTIEFPGAENLPLPRVSSRDTAPGYSYNSDGTPLGRPWWRARFSTSMPTGPFDTDVLHSVELASGDARMVAGRKEVPAGFFQAHRDYAAAVPFAHGMRSTAGTSALLWKGATAGKYVDLPLWSSAIADPSRTGVGYGNNPKIPADILDLRAKGWSGDFDNGWTRFPDGPFINKPDEGMMDTAGATASETPYQGFQWSLANGLFSPLRQVPSAVMFGSLPTGVKAGIPWRTLLFCPNPADPAHPGFTAPADHLLLDFFRMPVVEPYAVSGPVSTDGKINMNYAIAPFSYIRRASSWYSVLETLKIFSVKDDQSATYKGAGSNDNFRKRINIAETLKQFDERFADKQIFQSATEICTLFLVPENQTLSNVRDLAAGYWASRRLTGDNSREKPYAELYPKLTTQSNTYRVHMRVQALPPSAGIPAGKEDFEPLAEYRGSRLLERYLDPKNPAFATVDPDTSNLNSLFQYRVIESHQFIP